MKNLLALAFLITGLAGCATGSTGGNTSAIDWPGNAKPMLASRAVLDATMP